MGPKNNISLNLNNRNKKVNVFGNFGTGAREDYNGLNLKRTQNAGVFDQDQQQVSKSLPLNLKFGTDYFINSKNTIGFLVNGSTNWKDKSWVSTSKTFLSREITPTKIDSTLIASNTIIGNQLNANFNANYRFADTLGHTFTIDLDRGVYRATNKSTQPNKYVQGKDEGGKTLLERSFGTNTPSNINITTAKADYEERVGKKGLSFALGVKYANVITDNTFDFFNVVKNQSIRDVVQSNIFSYTERVGAAYFNTNVPFGKKTSLQAGLRYEQTYSKGDLKRDATQPIQTDDLIERKYGNLFPSLSFTYNPSEKHSFNATYSRRIDRPNYEDLNPFEWRLDELTFRKGNPFLRPQFSQNYEGKYTFMGFATLAAGYSKTTDLITDIVEFDKKTPDKSFINYRNLSNQDNYSLSLSSPTPIKKWWNGFVNITMYKSIYTANFPEYKFTAATPIAWNLYAEQTFSLPKGFVYEVSGWFNSASIWGGSWLSKPQGSFDMGIQKKILKDQGSLKLNVTDIFHTAPWRSFSDKIPGLVINGRGYWESQQVKLNFNYRFGNSNVKGAANRKTGLEDEKNRIKG
jgi:iron complex outermembrane recepter protein